mgnify:CR=1 FL=1
MLKIVEEIQYIFGHSAVGEPAYKGGLHSQGEPILTTDLPFCDVVHILYGMLQDPFFRLPM